MAVATLVFEFNRHEALIRKALEQVSDAGLNQVVANDHNSIAVTIKHLNGVLRARFTDFLTTDGDKPWRRREEEFIRRPYTRAEVQALWDDGWKVAEKTLLGLNDADLERQVVFRGQTSSAEKALVTILTHLTYHAAQIVLLARIAPAQAWTPITVVTPVAAARA